MAKVRHTDRSCQSDVERHLIKSAPQARSNKPPAVSRSTSLLRYQKKQRIATINCRLAENAIHWPVAKCLWWYIAPVQQAVNEHRITSRHSHRPICRVPQTQTRATSLACTAVKIRPRLTKAQATSICRHALCQHLSTAANVSWLEAALQPLEYASCI